MIGTELGPWTIEQELGSGGMGTVWLGTRGDERVAVKVVHPHLLAQPGFFKRFLREAEAGRAVRHENVVRTLDVDAISVDGTQFNFLVMEFVAGKTLRELKSELGTIPEALLREIARQVAAGLAAIHEAGIVHRDLKPENVLITDDHQVRIMDLGVARIVEDSIVMTRDGEFAGSLLYAAPEQFRSSEVVGPAADLYSLGVMLYELATGENPFAWDDTARIISAHLTDTPFPAAEKNPDVSLFLSEVLSSLLVKSAEDRFPSAAELATLLSRGEKSEWWAEREPELLVVKARRPKIPVRRETELHGRDAELTVLREAFAAAVRGEGATVFVEGETGVGKSRLVDSFLRELEGEDVHVLYGSYPPSGGIGGLSDAIVGHFGAGNLASSLAPYLTVTPSLVPAFAALIKHETPPTGSERPEGDALHAVVVHLMQALAAEKPLVWIVDDLHFAEPDSRQIVLAMARALSESRVLLVGTTRPGLLQEEMADFSRLGNFRRVPLGRLSPREVIQLLRDAFKSEALANKLAGPIALKSDGVPFFVFEMIRGLKEGQFIKELPDGTFVETRVIDDIEVPSAVRDLVEARLKDLSKEERAILDAGAVQGFRFEADLIARVLERKRIAVLQDLADIERRSGVVRADGDDYRFDHHQIQEVVQGDLASGLRKEYHAMIAEAFAERAGADGTEPADLPGEACFFLARHHLRGSRPRAALPFLTPALDRLTDAYRHEAALDLADRALTIDGLVRGETRVDVLLRKAKTLNLLGRRQEEKEALDEALRLADEGEDPRLRAKARKSLGDHLHDVSDFDGARRVYLETLEMSRAAGDGRTEASARNGLGSCDYRQGRYEEATAHWERALEVAREIEDLVGQGSATVGLGIAAWSRGRHEEAIVRYEESIALSRERGNRVGEARGRANVGHALLQLGRVGEAVDHLRDALGICREIGSRDGEAFTLGTLGHAYGHAGSLVEALAAIEETLAISRQTGTRLQEGWALAALSHQRLLLGDHDRAQAETAEAIAIADEIGESLLRQSARYSSVSLALARDHSKEAEAKAREAVRGARELGIPLELIGSLELLGQVLIERGHASEATELLKESLLLAQKNESSAGIVMSASLLALVPGGDVAAALEALEAHGDSLSHAGGMEVRLQLWRATGDKEHLVEANRLLRHLVEHAPEEFSESMIANVPEHREIAAAAKEHLG